MPSDAGCPGTSSTRRWRAATTRSSAASTIISSAATTCGVGLPRSARVTSDAAVLLTSGSDSATHNMITAPSSSAPARSVRKRFSMR